MNDSMNIEQYQRTKSTTFHWLAALSFAAAVTVGFAGCKGTTPAFSQAFGGFGAPARVPPPAQGSFQVPSSYSSGVGTSGSSPSSGLGSSSFGNGPKTSQTNLPSSNLFNSISNAQSQLLSATNNARNTVNRTADNINSSVELASARVDRLEQGVVQAGAIVAEAATQPIITSQPQPPSSNYANSAYPATQPAATTSNSGSIGDIDQSANASWRTPVLP
ncbi:MAG: hypothetical protein NTY15_02935 [Planctomycetota bacterium]|nr:hypothetical protein [Planctomycetota bacterium]